MSKKRPLNFQAPSFAEDSPPADAYLQYVTKDPEEQQS